MYYKVGVNKTAWHWLENSHIDKLNKIENAEIITHIYNQLIVNKDAKITHWEKNSVQ